MGMDQYRLGSMFGPYLTPQSMGYPFAPQLPWWDAGRTPLASAAAAGLQPMQVPLWPMGAGAPGMRAPGGLSPFSNGPAAPNVEAQAVQSLLQDASSGAIRKLFDYFSANSERFPQIGSGLALLNLAVEAFKAQDYARSFAQIFDVYRYLAASRAMTPDLPAMT